MSTLIERDRRHVWHPCTAMKDFETYPMMSVASASGSYLHLEDGSKIIDGISSWWCKSLGHGHPRIREALIRQASHLEHTIGANTTNSVIVELSEKLTELVPYLPHVFYAGDGSSAVEIALKMSLHVRLIEGKPSKTRIASLKNGYHGETAGAMSVSDLDIFKAPYSAFLFQPHILNSIPYVSSRHDPLWQNAELPWSKLVLELNQIKDSLTAIILEPLVQGASGMHLYSADFLNRISLWCKANDVHLIADEIMTGVGRTGTFLASEQADIQADFVCLSKGLTSGWLPFSAVLTSAAIFDHFYQDFDPLKSFLHSHTYSGNALGASVALETLKIITEEQILQQVLDKENSMRTWMEQVASTTGQLANIRVLGGIAAADLKSPTEIPRMGQKLAAIALKKGALLRPIGHTIYWLPPLNADEETISRLAEITSESIQQCISM